MQLVQATPAQPLHVTETITSRVIEILRAQPIGVRFSSRDISAILGEEHVNAVSASLHSKRNLGMYKVVGETVYAGRRGRTNVIIYEMLDPTVKMRLYCTRGDDVRHSPRPKGYTRQREFRLALGPDWRERDAAPALADESPPRAQSPVARASSPPASPAPLSQPTSELPRKTLSDQLLELAVLVETLEKQSSDLSRFSSEDLVAEMSKRGFRWVGLCEPTMPKAE